MLRTQKFPVFLFVVVLISNAFSNRCAGQESIEMHPKFTPGSVDYIELAEKIEDKWDASPYGPARTESHEWTRGVLRSIDPPQSEGTYTALLTFDRVVFRGKIPSGKIRSGKAVVYDSDSNDLSAPWNPARNISRLMIGKYFLLLITERGRGSGVVGLRTIYKTIEDREATNPLLETVMGGFSEDAARFTWGHFPYSLYAFASVKVGDTWGVPLRAFDVYLGETQYDMKCRLDGITTKNGRKIAKVSFKATLTTPSDARKGMYMGLLRLELDSGELEGTAEYDIETHEFVSQRSKTVMSISAMVADEDGATSSAFGLQRTIEETRTIMSQEQRAKQKEARRKAGK